MAVQRYNSLDILKGIAMLLVIADHSGFRLIPFFDFFEVPSFFIISGFLISIYERWIDAVRKKAWRIFPPYLLYSFAYIALCFWSRNVIWSPKEVLLGIIVPFNYPLWFLKALFIALALQIALIHLKFYASYWKGTLCVTLQLLMAFCVTNIRFPEYILWTGVPQALVALPLVTIGHLLRRSAMFKKMQNASRRVIGLGALGLLMVSLCSAHGTVSMWEGNIGEYWYLFYPVSGILFLCYCFGAEFLRQNSFLQWVGVNSMTFFGVHAIFLTILSKGFDINNPYILFLCSLIASCSYVKMFCFIRNRYRTAIAGWAGAGGVDKK